jgi:hypothetical protein
MTRFPAHRASHAKPVVAFRSNKTTVIHILLLASLLVSVLVTGVGAWAASPVEITITVTPGNVTLGAGAVQQFTATVQGTPNTGVIWSASAGTITKTGLFTAPKVSATTAVTIKATSIVSPSKSATAIVALVSQSMPVINTVNVPRVTTGQSYSFTMSASGGSSPYQWSINSGSLPPGIHLNGNTGTLKGTSGAGGQFNFSARVTDSAQHSDVQDFVMNVVPQGGPNSPPTQQSNFDGPAELPRVYVNSDMSNTPSPGKTWAVHAGGDVQQALNSAACGDIIALDAGATFSANLTIPAKNCDGAHWITVRTSAPDSALPPEGTRITPCYAGVASLPGRPSYNCQNPTNVMAKIVFSKNTGDGPIIFAPGANYYRLLGLEITRNANTPIVYALISMTGGYTADHLVFDRMWVHGTTHDDTTKGIRFGGSTNVAVIDSYFTDFHCTASTGACTDSGALGGGIGNNPMGPYKIVDNFLEASGESIMFGGAAATLTPADIEIRFNHMFKPLIWMKGQPGFVGGKGGYPFIVKNLFELKNAQRVLFEGNILENSWGGFTQTGYGLLLTPANQLANGVHVCPSCQVTDITLRYSTISHVASGMQVANGGGNGVGALAGERYSIHDIVIDDINGDKYNGFGLLAQVSMGGDGAPQLQHVNMEHITAFPQKVILTIGDRQTTKMVDFNFMNNMVLAGERPFSSTGGKTYNCATHIYYPITLFNGCFNPYQLTGNGIIATPDTVPPSVWPSGNYFPSSPQGLFVNYNGGNGGDYHLVNNSPYLDAATDGTALGADIDSVDQYTANSR